MNWTFAMNEENLGAPVWSQLTEPAGGVRSQGIFQGIAHGYQHATNEENHLLSCRSRVSWAIFEGEVAMRQRRHGFAPVLFMLMLLVGTSVSLAQSSASVQGGNFDLPDLDEPAERYEVFLGETRFLIKITVSVDPTSEAEMVELRDEGFGGTIRARIHRGTTKTVVLTTKLLSLRPSRDRRAFGTYQITVLERAP